MAEGIKIRSLQPTNNVETSDVFIVDKLSDLDPTVSVTHQVTYTKLLDKLSDDINLELDDGIHYIAFKPSDIPVEIKISVRPKTSAHRYFGYTDDGGNIAASVSYFINELEAPFLIFVPGITYRLDVSDYSNTLYPMKFYTLSPAGSAGGGDEIGAPFITRNGTAGRDGAYIDIKLEGNVNPAIFYVNDNNYYMGNQIFDPGCVTNGGGTIKPPVQTNLIKLSGMSGSVLSVSGFGPNAVYNPQVSSSIVRTNFDNELFDNLSDRVSDNKDLINDFNRSIVILRDDLQTSVENLTSISDSLDDRIQNNRRITGILDEKHDTLTSNLQLVRTDFVAGDDEIKQTLELIQSRLYSMEQQLSRVIQVED